MSASPRNSVDVVIPVYNEEEVLPRLLERLAAVFNAHPETGFRAFLVDDGSRDGSARLLGEMARRDLRFRPVRLSRNFGHQAALSAGLGQCGADAVVFLDADLQDPPELIAELIEKWREGAQVVRAERLSRADTGLRGLGFRVFHRFFNRFSDHPIPSNTGTFSLLDREAYEALRALPERHRFFPGLCAWIGFDQAAVSYNRDERAAGAPKQTLSRLIHYAMDALFSFSHVPLRLMIYLGLLISCLGFATGLYFVLKRLLGIEVAFTGFTTLIVTILSLGGIQLIAIGVIGEYLARVHDEAKQRPLFIVRRENQPSPRTSTDEPL